MGKRVAVIGACGHLGKLVSTNLDHHVRWTTVRCGRGKRNERQVDLDDMATLSALDDCYAVIDVSGAGETAVRNLFDYCLRSDKLLVETSANGPLLHRLIQSYANGHPGWQGRVLLGAGLFPGLSTLLAAELWRRGWAHESLMLAVAASPLSGAGRSVCKLMLELLRTASITYEGGVRREHAPAVSGPRVAYGRRQRSTVRVHMPECDMLHASTSLPSIDVYFSPLPNSLALLMRLVASSGLLHAPRLSRYLDASVGLLRSVLLARVPTKVDIVVLGDAGASMVAGHRGRLVAADGMSVCSHAIVAMLDEMVEREHRPGVWQVEQVMTIEPVLARMSAAPNVKQSMVCEISTM